VGLIWKDFANNNLLFPTKEGFVELN